MENLDKTMLQPKIYKCKDIPKASIFYFHGGGFLFGTKEDLPKQHIYRITQAGYDIYSFDYPLAPETKFPKIINTIIDLINIYSKKIKLPYFLWGRSAGGYISLLAPFKNLDIMPSGIISYYGYGLLDVDWYETPNSHYLSYQRVEKNIAESLIEDKVVYSYPAYPRFLLYLYTRQNANWLDYVWNGTKEKFLEEYSLKNKDFTNYPPTLLAHARGDTDVPYKESLILSEKIKDAILLSFDSNDHDFDKDESHGNTIELLDKTILFLDNIIG